VKGTGTAKATAATASFQVVTPLGGCGSLPASMVIRFGSGTGASCGARLNGVSGTLTYNSGTQRWTANMTDGIGQLFGVILQCAAGPWAITLNGNYTGGGTLAGTSGASPNLHVTFNPLSGCSGGITATITRT
jgi:hypothetical protein